MRWDIVWADGGESFDLPATAIVPEDITNPRDAEFWLEVKYRWKVTDLQPVHVCGGYKDVREPTDIYETETAWNALHKEFG